MSFAYSPKIIKDNLSLYLDPGNTKSYVSGSTMCYDLSRTEYDFIVNSGATFNSDNGGNIVFNGTSGFIYYNSTTAPLIEVGTNDYTFCGWFKFGAFTGLYRVLWYNSAIGGNAGFGFKLSNSSNAITVEVYGSLGGRQRISLVVTNYLNNWHHWSFVLVQSSFQILVYADGVLYTTLQYVDWGTINKSGSQVPVIGSHGGASWYYNGSIGPIQIYKDKALSSTEIFLNFNALKGRFGL